MMRRPILHRRLPSRLAFFAATIAFALPAPAEIENGISVSRPQIYDVRELELMLRSAEERLAQMQILDGTTLASAVGRTQGAEVLASSLGVAASTAPLPAVQTQETVNLAADGTSTQGLTTTTTGAAVTATPPAPPTAPAALSASAPLGPSARDLLAEQLSVTYQIVNLRLLLQRAVSERIDSSPQGALWREPVLLGFDVDLDPPPFSRDAVAEVVVRIGPTDPTDPAPLIDSAAAAVRSPGPDGGMTVIALFPAKDSYNVSTVTRKAREARLGATVGVVSLGVGGGSSRETLFLVKDVDTLAFERPSTDGPITFGWRFQPVLGSRVVEPGQRQVFALLSIEDFGIENCRELTVTVETHWRARKGRSRGARTLAPEPLRRHAGTKARHHLTLLPANRLADDLGPKVHRVKVSDAGGGQLLVDVEGKGFLPGLQLLHQRRLLSESDGFRVSGDSRLRFLASADAVAKGENVWILGRHGELRELRMQPTLPLSPPSAPASTTGCGSPGAAATGPPVRGALEPRKGEITGIRRISGAEVELTLTIDGALNRQDTYLVEIGGHVDAVVDVARSAAAAANPPSLGLRVPISRLFDDHEVTLFVPFSGDERDRIVASLPTTDFFQAARLEKLADVGDEVVHAVHGRNLRKDRLEVHAGTTTLACRDGGCEGDSDRLILRLAKQALKGVDHLILVQGADVQTLAAVAAKPPAPSGLSLGSTLRQHDSRDVELRGKDLGSVAEVRFESTPLALRREGGRLLVAVSRAVTEKVGDLQLMVVDKNGGVQTVPLSVTAR